MTANIQSLPNIPHYPSYLSDQAELAQESLLAGRAATPNSSKVNSTLPPFLSNLAALEARRESMPLGQPISSNTTNTRPIPIPPPRMSTPPSQSTDTSALVQRLREEVVLLANKFPTGTVAKTGLKKVEYQALLDNANRLTPAQVKRVNDVFVIIEQLKKDYPRQDEAKTSSEDNSDESPTGSPKKSDLLQTQPIPQKSTASSAPKTEEEKIAEERKSATKMIDHCAVSVITKDGSFNPLLGSICNLAESYKTLGDWQKSEIYYRLAASYGDKEAKTELKKLRKEHPPKKGDKKLSKKEMEAFVLADLKPIAARVYPEQERYFAEQKKACIERDKARAREAEEAKYIKGLAPLENVDAIARSAWDQFENLVLTTSRQFVSSVPAGTPAYIAHKKPAPLPQSSRKPGLVDVIINILSPGAISFDPPSSQQPKEESPFAVMLNIESLKKQVETDYNKYKRTGRPGPNQAQEDRKHASDVGEVVRRAFSYATTKRVYAAVLLAAAYPDLPARTKPICRDLAKGEVYSPYNNALTDGSLFLSARKVGSLFSQFTAAVIGGRPESSTECSSSMISYWPEPTPGISLERQEQLSRLEKPGRALASFLEELLTVTAVHSSAYLYHSDRGPDGRFVYGTYEARVPRYADLISCGTTEKLTATEVNAGVATRVPLLSLELLKNAKLPNLGDLSGLPAKDVAAAAAGAIADGSLAYHVTASLLYMNLKAKSPDSIIWIGDSNIQDNVIRISNMSSSETREMLMQLFTEGPVWKLFEKIWQISR